MAQEGRPRRGSLQFVPRKRATRALARVRSWPSGTGILGFLGYKVGQVTALVKKGESNSRLSGHTVSFPATVIETPDLTLEAIRFYRKTAYGLKTVGETSKQSDLEDLAGNSDLARLLFKTHPEQAGFPKKQARIVEIGFGGSAQDVLQLKELLGKEIEVSKVLNQSELIDAISITKGKGFQGVVKRYGVKLLSHRAEKSRRKVGSLGPEGYSRTMWTVPMPGQLGYHTRTEFNKEILVVSESDKINPSSGWHRYGLVRSKFIILKGTVPSPAKRAIILRKAIRPPKIFSPHKLEKIVFSDGEVVSV